MALYFVTFINTKHITWHMVPSFLYDCKKSALPGTPLPSNPSWSTVLTVIQANKELRSAVQVDEEFRSVTQVDEKLRSLSLVDEELRSVVQVGEELRSVVQVAEELRSVVHLDEEFEICCTFR